MYCFGCNLFYLQLFSKSHSYSGKPLPKPPSDACLPSPCGPNSQCRNINGRAVCSCLPEFIGRAPNCRPECTINTECPGNLACIREKCRDPCQGSCGSNSNCRVVQHSPVCQCNIGFTGDPFVGCTQQPVIEEEPHPCNPSPCGSNAVCTERNGVGSCTCLPEYFGDPYTSCKPECVINNDCPRDKTCVNMKCKDPCPGTCGLNADCRVSNHAPSCYCIQGYTGNPTVACHIIQPGMYHSFFFYFSSISVNYYDFNIDLSTLCTIPIL